MATTDSKSKSGLSGPSDLGSHDQIKNTSNPAYSHPNSILSKPQSPGKLGGYKVFEDKKEYQTKPANIQGVSATDLAAKPGPGSSVGAKSPAKTKGDDY